jgi:acylphosphatase
MNLKTDILQTHVIISGRVQGVCFRWFVEEHANKLGIKGWVKNCYDGTVEAVLQGTKKSLETLISILHEGPPLSRVDSININWEKFSHLFDDFSIRP